MKFTHNMKVDFPTNKFDLRIPGMGWGFRGLRISEGGKMIFEGQVLSMNNKIKFTLPKGMMLGKETIYTLEVGTIT